jgi:hypothetical protein
MPFFQIGDWERAQQILNGREAERIYRKRDELGRSYLSDPLDFGEIAPGSRQPLLNWPSAIPV